MTGTLDKVRLPVMRQIPSRPSKRRFWLIDQGATSVFAGSALLTGLPEYPKALAIGAFQS